MKIITELLHTPPLVGFILFIALILFNLIANRYGFTDEAFIIVLFVGVPTVMYLIIQPPKRKQ